MFELNFGQGRVAAVPSSNTEFQLKTRVRPKRPDVHLVLAKPGLLAICVSLIFADQGLGVKPEFERHQLPKVLLVRLVPWTVPHPTYILALD